MSISSGAHLSYYRSCHGRWAGELRFSITDVAAFRAAPISWLDRERVWSMALTSQLLGFVWMQTSVDCDVLGEGRVLHTTRLSRFGIPMLIGREVLLPREDGRSAAMHLEQRLSPTYANHRWDDGEVVVNDDVSGAVYDLPWIGGRMRQVARVVPDGLVLAQETPFSHGEVVLHRQR